jgi:hypothetical protein
LIALAAVTVLVGVATLPLTGHHSISAVFDTQKKITLSGELVAVDWVNPHIQLRMKNKNSSGAIETWRVEGSPPSWYRRVGANKATFSKHVGEAVTINGLPAKDGSTYGYMQRVPFANGDTLEGASASDVSKEK